MKSKKLIFLFSLPRSGSTLVQRVLAVHDALITASEPWLLLSLIASKKSEQQREYPGPATDFCE